MNKILRLLLVAFFSIQFAYAELAMLDDTELGDVTGQALIQIEDSSTNGTLSVGQPDGSTLEFTRVTLGAKIEINANIDEVVLGQYYRPGGTACTGGSGGRICYNNNAGANKWGCSHSKCGAVDRTGDFQTDALNGADYGAGFAYSSFPGGFFPTEGTDIKLRNVSMGRILADGTMEDFIMEFPYLDFAFDTSGGGRKLVGLRSGYKNANGVMGNQVDVITGSITPKVDTGILGAVIYPYLGGVRTVGYIDSSNFEGDLGGGLVQLLTTRSQIFPLHNMVIKDAKNFFISMNTREIQYPTISGVGADPMQRGFAINMENVGGTGLFADLNKALHPNNYFPGHPLNSVFPTSNNY